LPQNNSSPTTNVGAPKIPSAIVRSVSRRTRASCSLKMAEKKWQPVHHGAIAAGCCFDSHRRWIGACAGQIAPELDRWQLTPKIRICVVSSVRRHVVVGVMINKANEAARARSPRRLQ
jgi:hypothetical protein